MRRVPNTACLIALLAARVAVSNALVLANDLNRIFSAIYKRGDIQSKRRITASMLACKRAVDIHLAVAIHTAKVQLGAADKHIFLQGKGAFVHQPFARL